jgi:iron complex outermembrane receptor protein
VAYDAHLSGGNVVARWSAPVGAWSPSAQVYYDRTRREELAFQETRQTADVDVQIGRALGRHQVLFGGGYRASHSQTSSVAPLAFLPADRTDPLASAFMQDQVALGRRVDALFGVRIEHNRYSGFEAQPSARLTWRVDDRQTVVASITRALRTPSRVEQELVVASVLDPAIPRFLRLDPNPAFEPEKLTAFEVEYRVRLGDQALLRAAPFFNRHADLLSTEIRPIYEEVDGDRRRQILPLTWANGLRGASYGAELTADVRPAQWLRVSAHYGFLRIALSRNPGSGDVSQERAGEGTSPRHQLLVRSSANLGRSVELDWTIRHVSRLRAPGIPGYAVSDLRLGWQVNDRLSLSLVGTDLPGPRHVEFSGGAAGTSSLQRSVHGRITWRW